MARIVTQQKEIFFTIPVVITLPEISNAEPESVTGRKTLFMATKQLEFLHSLSLFTHTGGSEATFEALSVPKKQSRL